MIGGLGRWGGGERPPTDADRERYDLTLQTARAAGRIDDAELSRRAFRVRYATSKAELEDVVDDLPAPAPVPTRRSIAPMAVGVVATALVAGGAVVALAGGDDRPDASPQVVVDHTPVTDMFAPGALVRVMDELAERGVPAYRSILVYPERVSFQTQVAPGALQYDRVEYDGRLGEPQPDGQISGDDPAAEFFGATDFDPAVVAAIAARAGEVAGYEGRSVTHIIVERNVFYGGAVTIRAYVEGDAYSSGTMLTWSGDGQHLLDDGT